MLLSVLVIVSPIASKHADAAPLEATSTTSDSTFRLVTRFENDFLLGSDDGYSNGIVVGVSWQRDREHVDAPGNNGTVSISHALYTPARHVAPGQRERPYAGLLLLACGWNAVENESMRSTTVTFGMMGPSARGGDLQNAFHRLIGSKPRDGWDHQLGDKVVAAISTTRFARVSRPSRDDSTPGTDLIWHVGLTAGNLESLVRAGVQWRWGRQLSDSFGSAPFLSISEASAHGGAEFHDARKTLHAFAGLDLRFVAYDARIDADPISAQKNVDSSPVRIVASGGLGMLLDGWRWSAAVSIESPAFKGQQGLDTYASLTVERPL